jgi:hypothetical protein
MVRNVTRQFARSDAGALRTRYEDWARAPGRDKPLNPKAFADRIPKIDGVKEPASVRIGNANPVKGWTGIGLVGAYSSVDVYPGQSPSREVHGETYPVYRATEGYTGRFRHRRVPRAQGTGARCCLNLVAGRRETGGTSDGPTKKARDEEPDVRRDSRRVLSRRVVLFVGSELRGARLPLVRRAAPSRAIA